jgi:uncharacterized Zn finger protein
VRLSLNYPNGRSHVVEYEGPEEFRVGQEFELYGRRWRVAKIKRPRARGVNSYCVVSCVPITGSALRRDDQP